MVWLRWQLEVLVTIEPEMNTNFIRLKIAHVHENQRQLANTALNGALLLMANFGNQTQPAKKEIAK